MWKAFAELGALGWLETDRRPRMISCQSTGCDPITQAFLSGSNEAPPVDNAHTAASGLRVPKALGDFMILDAVRQSKGFAASGDEGRILEWMHRVTETEGISLCPEAAFCFGVLEDALSNGRIKPNESIVLFNTGAAQKYVEVIDRELPQIDKNDVDWDAIAAGRG